MAQSIQKWMLKSCISKQSMQLRKLSMAPRYISIYPASSSSSINVLMKKMTKNDDNQQQTLSTSLLMNNRSIFTIMNSNNDWYNNNNNNGILNCKQIEMMIKRNSHKPPLTVDYIRERILLVLRLYDKIDPDKLTIDSHFYKDLGLDSLDHVEIIMAIEDEFHFEIPDGDAEKLNTPRDILNYIQIKEEIYSELEHRDDHHSGGHH